MRFAFTEEQEQLRDAARDFFAGECPPGHVRAMLDDETGRSPALWRKMADTGFVGLTVPEAAGGLGMDEVDLVLLLEEAGRACLPEPLLETTAVGVPLLVESGSAEQHEAWLPRIAAGDAIVTVQLDESALVADAHVADLLLCVRGDEVHAVPAGRVQATAQPSLDGTRRLFAVEPALDGDTLLPGSDAQAIARARDRASAACAALLCGIGLHLLETTTDYVKQRQQFGQPVGSFQAVQHKLAETLVAVETARSATWYAAYAIARDLDDRPEAVSVAKAYAAGAEAKANIEALQLHGGIGFTWEHDLHLWLKRGKALEQAYGTPHDHRERLAGMLLDR